MRRETRLLPQFNKVKLEMLLQHFSQKVMRGSIAKRDEVATDRPKRYRTASPPIVAIREHLDPTPPPRGSDRNCQNALIFKDRNALIIELVPPESVSDGGVF